MIGINYRGTRAELRGCIKDVHNMQRLLTETFGWRPDAIRTLTDDNPRHMPTRENIIKQLHWLADGARAGDVLFFHYSGHGAQKEDPHGYEEDGMNETIIPVDFQSSGQITDDEISDIIVKPLPEGLRLTAVMDCCHSGTGLDLPFTFRPRGGWKEETNPFHSACDVQMFSGCEDDDTSADAADPYGQPGGAMTTAFCEVLRSRHAPSYPEFMQFLHLTMKQKRFKQRPQLTSTQAFEYSRPFNLNEIIPNSNAKLGRTFRRRFPPNPRKSHGDDPLQEMLAFAVGAAAVGLAAMVFEAVLA